MKSIHRILCLATLYVVGFILPELFPGYMGIITPIGLIALAAVTTAVMIETTK